MASTKSSRPTVSSGTVTRREEADRSQRVIHVQKVTSSQEQKDAVARALRAGRDAQTTRE